MIAGNSQVLGATPGHGGVNFALYSSVAERVELCLYTSDGKLQGNVDLADCDDHVWHGFLPKCAPGQRYGYRVHGPYEPDEGLHCNPAKLLIDPYARRIDGEVLWRKAVNGNNSIDSAPYVPKSVVCATAATITRPLTKPMSESVLYEANVRGLTMNHPGISAQDRGKFAGMHSAQIIEHVKAMGITAIELMPVHAFVDEHHLYEKGLRNFWGYNTLGFFAPMSRYASHDPVNEFRHMVHAFHDAGLEVILDVVFNHTAEGDHRGPMLSFRGIDNLAYYRMSRVDPAYYVNDTGCGNTLNCDQPAVQRLIIDSLCYWVSQMGVDGFRFDLAPILARHAEGFSPDHPLLKEISSHAALKDVKLIAEPWDPGPGGYQLGQFPSEWAEWNDKYRDDIRSYWRQDSHKSGDLARRLHGSAELFESNGRAPSASINFITSHDGFTLSDVAAYTNKHNEANGEENRDGHSHNYSLNFGIEGPSDDSDILAARRRHRLNLLATLLVSQGTPLLLAGDELGNSQGGNNNAYAQDNAIGWVDWSGLASDPEFTHAVQQLVRLRANNPLLRLDKYVHDTTRIGDRLLQVYWLNANGNLRFGDDWSVDSSFTMVIHESRQEQLSQWLAILFNATSEECSFTLDTPPKHFEWHVEFYSAAQSCLLDDNEVSVPQNSMAIMVAKQIP